MVPLDSRCEDVYHAMNIGRQHAGNIMRLERTDSDVMRVRPSRLYSFLDRRLRDTAVGAVFFASIGIFFAVTFVVLLVTPDTDPATGAHVRTSPWMVIPTLVMVSMFFLIAHVTWSEIPPRVILTILDQARSLCADRPFVLILWSFREYHDLLGTIPATEGVHPRRVNVPQSLDGYIAEVASEFGFRSIRLWHKDSSRLVGVSSKSIHVICPDMIWREVVLDALSAAAAILLVPGRGEGLAWEREVVATSAELKAKTLNLSALKMEELRAALTIHFKAVTAHVRVTSPVRAIQ